MYRMLCCMAACYNSCHMTPGAIIQLFYEFTPVVAFFIAGKLFSFQQAVLTLIVATLASLVVAWVYHRRLPIMPLASGVLVLIAGLVTVLFHTPDAIILADTIYYWSLAGAIMIGFYKNNHILDIMFNRTIAITDRGWDILSTRWLVALLLAGVANEYVRHSYTAHEWIDYRFCSVLLIMGFACYQITLSRKYRIEGESNTWGLRIKD